MKARVGIWIVICAIGFASAREALCREIVVYHNESMPFCGTQDGQPKGVAVEVLQAISQEGGPSFRFVSVPWKRAQSLVKTTPNSALIPFTRTEEREPHYKWITPLLTHQLRLSYTLIHDKNPEFHKRIMGALPITLETAKTMRVGIIRASAYIPLLQDLGFQQLIELNDAGTTARVLRAGYIDLQAESQWVDTYHWKQAGYSPNELIEGQTIGDVNVIYLAAGLNFPETVAEQIRDAIERIEAKGKLQTILDQWK